MGCPCDPAEGPYGGSVGSGIETAAGVTREPEETPPGVKEPGIKGSTEEDPTEGSGIDIAGAVILELPPAGV